MLDVLIVGLGGFLGASMRYLIGLIPVDETLLFPVKTFAINIIGCIAIAVIAVYMAKNSDCNQHIMLFLKVGLCGGFTTYSTFALETSNLMKTGHIGIALLYIILSLIVGVLAIFVVEYAMR